MLQDLEFVNFLKKTYVKLNAPSLAQKTNFFRLLALAQTAGLSSRDALLSIKKTEKNRGLLMIISSLVEELGKGKSFSDALAVHDYIFKEEEIALIKAAETIGNLPEVLQDISFELENEQEINQKIKKASTYPVILLSFSFLAVIILITYVIPTVVGMFPSGNELPGITLFMLGISGFFKSNWSILLISIVSLVLAYKFLYQYFLPFKMFIDKLFISVPVISAVVKTYYMYRFSTLLGKLYKGGISPVVALKLISNVFGNYHYRKKVLEVQSDLKSGFSLAESMEGSTLFDPILIQIIHVGEETGNMSDVLNRISGFYNSLLKNKIDILLSFIEPFLMAFIAVIIGVIVGSIFIPMADVVNTMQ